MKSLLRVSAVSMVAVASSLALSFGPATSQLTAQAVAPQAPSAAAAVPGVDTSGGTYLDENGHVLSMRGTDATVGVSPDSGRCTPVSGRDNPHYTAPDVSGHGWWGKGSCTHSTATVYNCLYEYYTDGTWRRNTGWCSPKKTLKPGTGGSAQRTNARVTCESTSRVISWRNHVDVDVNGQSDTAEEPYNQANVSCEADAG
jgi:hypothetical protein